MPSNNTRHYFGEINPSLAARTVVSYEREKQAEFTQRENDRLFLVKLAEAIFRGDHLPAGKPKPVRPLVLTP